MTNDTPRNLNWVAERSKCSLSAVFKELEIGVKEDVKAVNALYPNHPPAFSVTAGKNQFSVILVVDALTSEIAGAVDFELGKDDITVKNPNSVMFKATITLNNEGECKLRLGDDQPELEQWQVRRMALEKLFFGPRDGRSSAPLF
jgi:hypothetical protein